MQLEPRNVGQPSPESVDNPVRAIYPEIEAGGFSRVDGTISFYTRVNALLADIGPEAVVLDYGAGRGSFLEDPIAFRRDLRALRGRARRVIGIDIDEAVLENETVDEAYVVSPGESLPLGDGSVDIIISDFTFEHVSDPTWTTAELDRVLRPGGWLCARTPNRWGYIGLGAQAVPNQLHVKLLRHLQPTKKAQDTFPTAYRLNTSKDLKHWFPTCRYNHFVYASDSEPAYVGRSVLAARLTRIGFGLTPPQYRSMLNVFLHKVSHAESEAHLDRRPSGREPRLVKRTHGRRGSGGSVAAPLIIAGAQKSASTSVASWFGEHDNVIQLGTECIAFEGRVHRIRTRRVQSKVSRLDANGIVCVLKRPEILHNQHIRNRASAAFPEAVAVAVLRDPVDRAVSAWDHYWRSGVIGADLRLRDCVTAWQETGDQTPAGQIIGFSLYAAATVELRRSFRRTNIVFHEDVLRDPAQTFREVFDQLELRQEPRRVLPVMNTREQGLRGSPFPSLSGRVGYRWDSDERHLSPRSIGYRVVAASRTIAAAVGHAGTTTGLVVTEDDRNAVRDVTRPDLARLEELLGRPLPSSWRQS